LRQILTMPKIIASLEATLKTGSSSYNLLFWNPESAAYAATGLPEFPAAHAHQRLLAQQWLAGAMPRRWRARGLRLGSGDGTALASAMRCGKFVLVGFARRLIQRAATLSIGCTVTVESGTNATIATVGFLHRRAAWCISFSRSA
jgi:hypothetical protein